MQPLELFYHSGEFSTKPKRLDGIYANIVGVLMDSEPAHPAIAAGDHKDYMKYALEQARRSPPLSTNFCVGAVLVDADKNEILSTGYTLELLGNTHAEQCCLIKVAQARSVPEERLGEVLPRNTVLYTTMEPCNKRLSGNKTCVERVLGLKGAVKTVYVGIKEPEKFVGQNEGRKRLEDAGIVVTAVEGLEDQILEVSTVGHETVKNDGELLRKGTA